MKLNVLFCCGKLSVLDRFESGYFTIRNLLRKGRGILSEITAYHVTMNDIPPKLLTVLGLDEKSESCLETQSKNTNDVDESNIELKILLNDSYYKGIYDALQYARKYLPKSLESDILLVNGAWESIKVFNKDDFPIKYLQNSLRYCSEIGNAILKQGILSLLWHTFLSNRIKLLTELIDKVLSD
jgi:hypothetical protein